jgi:cell wall-associated NlpC family hydrolase
MEELTEYALSLSGTPYKYGGTSPDSGFDCSGFVGYVFKHSLGKSLPRSSEAISRIGLSQKPENLKPGDLVFYNTLHKPYSHVGIYLGDGQFIHSPSRGKSVSIVNMNEDYWRARYNGARRLKP